MQIKGAIFDMDGTLVDSLGFWENIWARIGARYLGDPEYKGTPELTKRFRTTTVPQCAEIFHREYGYGESSREIARFLTDSFTALYRTKAVLKPGCLEFLEALKARGVKMCLASASNPEMVGASIEHCGIGRFFSEIFFCDSFGAGKDRPDVFLAAWKHLGTPMEETWVFEDSAVALATAQKAGFRTVGIFDRHTPDQAPVMASSTEYIAEGETLLRLL
ncbi:MAG: HAD family phosphatase [Clostridia bacterium]|nr:HAD family phosphatase [Clostridia bacterium]